MQNKIAEKVISKMITESESIFFVSEILVKIIFYARNFFLKPIP